MASNQEVEIKFRIESLRDIRSRLRKSGFRLITRRTHEMNTLYDLDGQPLRKRGDVLRLRKYGKDWVLTHKSKGKAGRHKIRTELETKIQDGHKMDSILRAARFSPSFRYEKFRSEWSDGRGALVLDETPIGNLGEIEGKSRWIDRTARTLGIGRSDYINLSYAELFYEWKKRTRSAAKEMTFKEVRKKR